MVDIKIIDLAVVTQTFLSEVIDHLTPSEIITVDGLIFLSSDKYHAVPGVFVPEEPISCLCKAKDDFIHLQEAVLVDTMVLKEYTMSVIFHIEFKIKKIR